MVSGKPLMSLDCCTCLFFCKSAGLKDESMFKCLSGSVLQNIYCCQQITAGARRFKHSYCDKWHASPLPCGCLLGYASVFDGFFQ